MQAEAEATGARRREVAARLVQVELQIWKTAQAWLAKAGVEQHESRLEAGASGASSRGGGGAARTKRKR